MNRKAPLVGFVVLLILGLGLTCLIVGKDGSGPEILGTTESPHPAAPLRAHERRSRPRVPQSDLPAASGPLLIVIPSDLVDTSALSCRIFEARTMPKELAPLIETAAAFLAVEASALLSEVGVEIPQVRPGIFLLGDSHELRFAVVDSPNAWAIARVDPWESEVSCRLDARRQVDLRLQPVSAVSRLSGPVRMICGETKLEIADISELRNGRSIWNPRQAIQLFGWRFDRDESLLVAFDRAASAPIDERSARQTLTLDVEGLTTIVLAVDHDNLGTLKPTWRFSLTGKSKDKGDAAVRETTTTSDRVVFVVGNEDFPLEAVVRLDVDGAPVASVEIDKPPREPVVWLKYALPGVILTGSLVDEAQSALAQKSALSSVVDGGWTVEDLRISSDDGGRFVAWFDELRTTPHARTFTVVAAGPAYRDIRGETILPAATSGLVDLGTITLKQGTVLVAGSVSDGGSHGLSGISIDVWYREVALGTTFGQRTAMKVVTSDENGHFVATAHAVLPGTDVTLVAEDEKYRQSAAETVSVGSRDVDLRLAPAARLIGRVTVDRPELIRSVELRVTGKPAHSLISNRNGVTHAVELTARPNADGKFEFGSLGGGTATLCAWVDSLLIAQVADVQLRPGEVCRDSRLNPLELRSPTKLELRIEKNGRYVQGANVWFRPTGSREAWSRTQSGSAGDVEVYVADPCVDAVCFHPEAAVLVARGLTTGGTLSLTSGPTLKVRLVNASSAKKSEMNVVLMPEDDIIDGIESREFAIRLDHLRVGETRDVSLPVSGGFRIDAQRSYEEARSRSWLAVPARIDVKGAEADVLIEIVDNR